MNSSDLMASSGVKMTIFVSDQQLAFFFIGKKFSKKKKKLPTKS
jgi:hypothetical protein